MPYSASDRTVGGKEGKPIWNKVIWARDNGESKKRKKERERKNIIVAAIREKHVENVLLSILRISGP